MSARASVIAFGAVSPLGEGEEAIDLTRVGVPAPVAIERDETMEADGFIRPFCARVSDDHLAPADDRADALLSVAVSGLLTDLAGTGVLEGRARVGLVVGTSSGGMRSAERYFAARQRAEEPSAALAGASTYFAPFVSARAALARSGMQIVRSLQIVNACAASTWALGVGLLWLRREAVDVVIAGGYDALGPFVAAGFESLRATASKPASPFRLGRDGMALGEGAALVALVREGEERGKPARFFVSGFGASTDAVHITAPDRTGGGLARAAKAALADSAVDLDDVGLVSAHATATPYNDAMESRAIRAALDDRAPVVHPMKAQVGHTLGAAGIIESLAAGLAVERGVAPAAAGEGEIDPDAPARLLEISQPFESGAALKLSAAFGGMNAALVLESPARKGRLGPRTSRRVYLKALESVRQADAAVVAAATGIEADKIRRIDDLSLLAATAVAALGKERIQGGGIVLGHSLATIDINERFYSRILARGPAAAEPRLFPPTSPNLMPGQIAILFELTGPSAATASGPGGGLDALALAAEIVAAGAAERMVACSMDLLGPASTDVLTRCFPDAADVGTGAAAALVEADPAGALCAIDIDAPGGGFGHLALARELARLTDKKA
ncbi:MAG: 3-oxoacyl-ACP synthase [Myxococcales bacterium]|nr:3-oxoacyl-ACP synthase [Myxococcales bacterium]